MSAAWFDSVSITVRVAFATNPGDAPTWVDVSAYVRSITTHRGRISELDTYQAGTATVVLDNRDRRFDPSYAAGAYYPNVLPMRKINIQATYSAVTYDLFTGYVDGWPQAYTNPSDATVTVTATDAFKFLANSRLPESVYAIEVKTDTPTGWYRLGESSGTAAFDSSGNGRHGVYEGGATFNSRAGLIVGSSDAAIYFDGIDNDVALGPSSDPVPTFPFSIELWVALADPTVPNNLFHQSSGNFYVAVYCLSPGYIVAAIQDSTGASASSIQSTLFSYENGAIYHIVATFLNGSTIPVLYINGIADAGSSSSTVGTVVWTSVPAVIGRNSNSATYALGTIDEVATYPSVLSAGRVSAHYAAGTSPWTGDDTGARITRILDQISWPAADRSIATGKATLGNQTLNADVALTLLQACETSEQGYLFAGPDGKVTFQNRHQRLTAAASVTSQATFGDSGSNLPYTAITLPYEDHTVVNRVKGQRVGGSVIEVTDATSIATYLERAVFFNNLQQSTDLEVTDLVNWKLSHYKDALLRVDEMTMNPRTAPATLYPQVLGRTFGDRVTVNRTPQKLGAQISKDVHVEGIDHSITPDNWTTKFYLSPADTQTYLILDDATFGQLDSNRLAF